MYSKNGLKTCRLYSQRGAMISEYYMPKHIQTAKHTRDMIRMYGCMYVHRENCLKSFQFAL